MRKQYLTRKSKTINTNNLSPEMEMYEQYYDDRDIVEFTMHETVKIPRLEPEKMRSFQFKRHTWKMGDKFHKLSFEY